MSIKLGTTEYDSCSRQCSARSAVSTRPKERFQGAAANETFGLYMAHVYLEEYTRSEAVAMR